MLMMYLVLAFIALRIILMIMESVNLPAFNFRLFSRRAFTNGIFVNSFIDSRALFATRFNKLPNVAVITQVDATQAYALVTERLGNDIADIFQTNMYDHNESRMYFTMTIMVLANKRMIEIGNGYVEILYTSGDYAFATDLVKELAACRIEETIEVTRTPIIGFARTAEMN